MTLENPRHLDHRPQLASHGPRIPSLEEAIGTRRIDMTAEPAEQIGDSPGSGRLQTVLRGFPWLEAVDSRGGDDWVESRDGNTLIALRPFARPR